MTNIEPAGDARRSRCTSAGWRHSCRSLAPCRGGQEQAAAWPRWHPPKIEGEVLVRRHPVGDADERQAVAARGRDDDLVDRIAWNRPPRRVLSGATRPVNGRIEISPLVSSYARLSHALRELEATWRRGALASSGGSRCADRGRPSPPLCARLALGGALQR